MKTARSIMVKRLRCAWVGGLVLIVLHLLISLPILADNTENPDNPEAPLQVQELETKPVFLDGDVLFEVPGAGDLTAFERAKTIERSLVPLMDSPEPVEVRIEYRGSETSDGWKQTSTPVIFADDSYIMSITTNDVEVGAGGSPQAQAQLWAEVIDSTLTSVQAVRQEGRYLRALVSTLLALGVALGIHWFAGKLWHDWLPPMLTGVFSWSDSVDGDVTGLKFLFHLSLFLVRGGRVAGGRGFYCQPISPNQTIAISGF
jgi:potassium efflux system protein